MLSISGSYPIHHHQKDNQRLLASMARTIAVTPDLTHAFARPALPRTNRLTAVCTALKPCQRAAQPAKQIASRPTFFCGPTFGGAGMRSRQCVAAAQQEEAAAASKTITVLVRLLTLSPPSVRESYYSDFVTRLHLRTFCGHRSS